MLELASHELPAGAALDGAVAFFMRGHRFPVEQCVTHNQCRRAGLHQEDHIDLRFVQLNLAVGFPVNQHERLIRKVRERLHGEMMRVGHRLRSERRLDLSVV